MKVGYIGLGKMGGGMAANILAARAGGKPEVRSGMRSGFR